ncbi:MAG: cation-transporting P-type ATPase [Thermoanaerobacterales bacterium]|nr:cation-transporting P-type ATPase [Thermoanaerobacterales bacterium]
MNNDWHRETAARVGAHLGTDLAEGLTQTQVQARLAQYGPNRLPERKGPSAWVIFLAQFKSVIVLLLIAAAAVSAALGDLLEAGAIAVVILLNAVTGFIMEFRAAKAMDVLRRMVTVRARVIRDGRLHEVDAAMLVPGDLIVFEEGDRVPADARLVSAENLATVEASLTGESEPVEKDTAPLDEPGAPPGDRINMVFSGTSVARGTGRAVVVATGERTEIGRISALLEETEDEHTPLEKRMGRLGRTLALASLGIALVVGVVGVLTGKPPALMLTTAIALAVAAVPEGLPAVATITLAIGMRRMARQQAIIRRLPAVETLGSTTVICTDKTGTLTENQMTVERIWQGGRETVVTGLGYVPEGEFRQDEVTVAPQGDLSLLLQAGALANRAAIGRDERTGEWKVIGDPTEGALVVAARKAGFSREEAEDLGFVRRREIPFSSEEKRMAVYYDLPDGSTAVFAKGAPAAILEVATHLRVDGRDDPLGEDARARVQAANDALASEGLRVLALAYRPGATTSEETPYHGLVLLGLVGLADPPRKEVPAAIAEARRAGVRTIMITGDQPATAKAIARRIGLGGDDQAVVHGRDLGRATPDELRSLVAQTAVFARVSPEHKLALVRALQDRGEVVAMTGDGVNDAPALRRADIGVAMGIQGTAVAREAADMVLADDNFATIIRAVKQGRVIFDNIQKFIHYLFSCNLSEILVIFIAIVAGLPIPLVVLQILWLNMLTDVFPALALGWEPAEPGVMRRPPRSPRAELVDTPFFGLISAQGLFLAIGTLGAYYYVLASGGDIATARTVAFVTIALVQVAHVFNVRRHDRFGVEGSLLANPFMLGALGMTLGLQILAVYLPGLNLVLDTVPLTGGEWLVVAGGVIGPVAAVWALKRVILGRRQAVRRKGRAPGAEDAPRGREDWTVVTGKRKV